MLRAKPVVAAASLGLIVLPLGLIVLFGGLDLESTQPSSWSVQTSHSQGMLAEDSALRARLVELECSSRISMSAGGSMSVLEQTQQIVSPCETIHIAIVCAGYRSARDVMTLLKSILFYRTNPIHFHLVSDRVTEAILTDVFASWLLTGADFTFYSAEAVKSEVSWVRNRHYSGVFGLMKLEFPTILPETLEKVIVLDTDITVGADIAEVWSMFSQMDGKLFGLADNLSDWYLKIWPDRHPWPALGRGFNTGVMLLNLAGFRGIDWRNRWRATAEKYLLTLDATQLADQDIINAMIYDNPSMILRLPCEWNLQLSLNSRLGSLCPSALALKSRARAVHFNSPPNRQSMDGTTRTSLGGADGRSKRKVMSRKAYRALDNLYLTFLEYDGALLRDQLLLDCKTGRVNLSEAVRKSEPLEQRPDPTGCDAFSEASRIVYRVHPYYLPYSMPAWEDDSKQLNTQSKQLNDNPRERQQRSAASLSGAAFSPNIASLPSIGIFPNKASKFPGPADDGDVTLVAQLSMDRLQMLEKLASQWVGPMSVALYLSESEAPRFLAFAERSAVLSSRTNIGLHAVFKGGELYPVNHLRNVALRYIRTEYSFLSDIDFLPSFGLYEYLVETVKLQDMATSRKALVVPAFQSQEYRLNFPSSKTDLISMIDASQIYSFRYHVWQQGHAPTNFHKWMTALLPYKVSWEPNFEPYVVLKSTFIPPYDQRFVGFGWNKVSHIMQLDAEGFEFIVIPNGFIVHIPHAASFDIAQFRSNEDYRRCLNLLKSEFQRDLSKKYRIKGLKYLSAD